jgi:chromosome partitioning protein
MRTIAFLTQKGGAGKTTLAASLAVAAAGTGERVIAVDLDPQASLVSWGERRKAAKAPNNIVVEPLDGERLPRLQTILEGLAAVGFTLAIFDTPGANRDAPPLVAHAADICLLPARPTRLDVDVTAATYRAAYLAKRKAAFLLNHCPPNYPSSRTSEMAKTLTHLGVLAEPMLSARMDFQDAVAAGLGVTEYAREGRAAQEIEALWGWIRTQFEGTQSKTPVDKRRGRQAPRFSRFRIDRHFSFGPSWVSVVAGRRRRGGGAGKSRASDQIPGSDPGRPVHRVCNPRFGSAGVPARRHARLLTAGQADRHASSNHSTASSAPNA